MNEEKRFYLTAAELSDLMGISIGHAYKLIRDMNAELAKDGYIVVAGKVPKRYGAAAKEKSAHKAQKYRF